VLLWAIARKGALPAPSQSPLESSHPRFIPGGMGQHLPSASAAFNEPDPAEALRQSKQGMARSVVNRPSRCGDDGPASGGLLQAPGVRTALATACSASGELPGSRRPGVAEMDTGGPPFISHLSGWGSRVIRLTKPETKRRP